MPQALSRTRFQHVFLYPTGPPLHPSTEYSLISCSQLHIENNSLTRCANPIANKVANSSAKGLSFPLIRSPHHLQYRLHQPFTTPPFPAHPEISMPVDRRSEGLLRTSEGRPWALKLRTKRSRRMSLIARHPATMTTD